MFTEASKLLEGVCSLAKVDVTKPGNSMFFGRYGVRSTPSMKIFRYGTPFLYKGPRCDARDGW